MLRILLVLRSPTPHPEHITPAQLPPALGRFFILTSLRSGKFGKFKDLPCCLRASANCGLEEGPDTMPHCPRVGAGRKGRQMDSRYAARVVGLSLAGIYLVCMMFAAIGMS
jgi:hypothetical protein